MKFFFLKVMAFLVMSTAAFSSAWAGVEIKGACGYSDKPLALAWAAPSGQDKLKMDVKNTADALNQFLDKGCDFALTETQLTATQLKKTTKRKLLYIPVALSAQAIVYNLPGVPNGALKLTPTVISDIFLGRIKNWNDPAIRQLNPGLLLPEISIMVLHESSEGTLNDLFPAFLAHEDPKWTLKREKEKDLHWPVGQNLSDNLKTLDKIRQWAGVISSIDFSFAQENNLPVARVKNAADQYVAPSVESIKAAAGTRSVPEETDLTKSQAKKAYPFSGLVLAVVDQDYEKTFHQHEKGKALVGFLNRVLSDKGQENLAALPLPESWTPQLVDKVNSIKY